MYLKILTVHGLLYFNLGFSVYLGGREYDAFDLLRLCEDLNLLNDPRTLIKQNHFVQESRLWTSERDDEDIFNTEYRFKSDELSFFRPALITSSISSVYCTTSHL